MHNPCLNRPWASAHPPTAHTTCSPTILGGLAHAQGLPHQQHNPHNMPTCNTQSNYLQPTNTCPYIQLAPTSPMLWTHHLIITATQSYLALKPPNSHTRNQQLSYQCHTPLHRVNTTCCCPSSKSISTHYGPPLQWPRGVMWSKVPPHTAPSSCSSI